MDSLPERVWIEVLASEGKDVPDAVIRGIVIDLREVLKKGPFCRVQAVIDDGSGALTAVFDRDLTESLLGKTLDACLAEAREAMSQEEVIRNRLADLLVTQPIEVRGKVVVGIYGLMLLVKEVRILRIDG